MEKKLNEKELLREVKKFTEVSPSGLIAISMEMIENEKQAKLLYMLKETNRKKYSLQYTMLWK